LAFPDGTDEQLTALRETFGLATPSPPGEDLIRSEQEELNGLTTRALSSYDGHPLLRWGLVPNRPSLAAFISHMFLHAGWLHLLGNLVILYLAGPFIEDVWGRPLYAGFYAVAGLAAAAAHIALQPESSVPMIGASGAIAGLMGAFLVRYRTTKIRFFYMIGFFFRGTFSAPAWIMLPLWFTQQIFFGLMPHNHGDGSGGGVAYWAHIGGFAFGAVAAFTIQRNRIEERFIEPQLAEKIASTVVSNPAVDRALELQQRGQAEEAFSVLAQTARLYPTNQDSALALWTVASELGRAREAAPQMLRVIDSELRNGETGLALQHWDELEQQLPELEVDAAVLVRLACALAGEDRRDSALVVTRRALLGAGTPTMALRVAQAARELDPQLARGAARVVLSRAEPGSAEFDEAQRLLVS
jgi:membrane associated rhomboid family serine protease